MYIQLISVPSACRSRIRARRSGPETPRSARYKASPCHPPLIRSIAPALKSVTVCVPVSRSCKTYGGLRKESVKIGPPKMPMTVIPIQVVEGECEGAVARLRQCAGFERARRSALWHRSAQRTRTPVPLASNTFRASKKQDPAEAKWRLLKAKRLM